MSAYLQPLWQQRIIKERDDLSDKYSALRKLLDSPRPTHIDEIEWSRLHAQSLHMSNYLQVLNERIANFK